MNEMRQGDFEDLTNMKIIVDIDTYDREGRPIQFLILRNMNLKRVSYEHF